MIGDGSFGRVYRARQLSDGRAYAVKVAKEKYRGRGDRDRKLEEVKNCQLLSAHPNCVEFVRSWEEAGRLYLQLELCETS